MRGADETLARLAAIDERMARLERAQVEVMGELCESRRLAETRPAKNLVTFIGGMGSAPNAEPREQ